MNPTVREMRRIARRARRWGYRGKGRGYLALVASASEYVRSRAKASELAAIAMGEGAEDRVQAIALREAVAVADLVADLF